MTQPAACHAETLQQALLEEALLLAHQLKTTVAVAHELARLAAQATLQAQAAACVEGGGRSC